MRPEIGVEILISLAAGRFHKTRSLYLEAFHACECC